VRRPHAPYRIAHRRARRFWRLAGVLLLFVALGWGAGLVWYIRLVGQPVDQPVPAATDGIVALTGGAERVETALRLLAQGRAEKLLLSGIGGRAEFSEFAARAGVEASRLEQRVTLGRDAHSTHGNAIETAAWVRREGVRSLIVVTAAYHMPRALIEFHAAMPDVVFYPMPVVPPGFEGLRRLRLVAEEFTKYLAAEIGLSVIGLPAEFSAQRSAVPG
jgi:uncharacterized SAM-binding protein YcdF (DUF218 family)